MSNLIPVLGQDYILTDPDASSMHNEFKGNRCQVIEINHSEIVFKLLNNPRWGPSHLWYCASDCFHKAFTRVFTVNTLGNFPKKEEDTSCV